MKIARPKKVEIKLTVLIVISLILLTACGAQPTTEPTPVSTVVLIQPASSLTPTSTPAVQETPVLPATPEARMTVEQQLAYLESYGVPVIINEKGEVVFDWMKMQTDPDSMPIVHQETLADNLAFWAEIFHKGFPEPNTHDPADFSPVGWFTAVDEKKQLTRFAVNILSDKYKDKLSPHQSKAAVFGMIDGERYAFYFGRGLVTEAEEVVKNGGSYFVEFWVQSPGSGYLQESSALNNVTTINGIINGTYLLGMDNINGTLEDLKSGPVPEWTSWQRANYFAWHLLNADLVGPDGKNILSVDDDALLQRLVDWRGFAAATNGKLLVGGHLPVTDIVPASVFVPTPIK